MTTPVGRTLTPNELRSYGLAVTEIPGWETRRTSILPFRPVGQMAHHTAGTDSQALIVARALSQMLVRKDGVIVYVASGRTAHPGNGSSVVLDEVRQGIAPSGTARQRGLADNTRGYQYFVGYEVENRGDGRDPYRPCRSTRSSPRSPPTASSTVGRHRPASITRNGPAARSTCPGPATCGPRSHNASES